MLHKPVFNVRQNMSNKKQWIAAILNFFIFGTSTQINQVFLVLIQLPEETFISEYSGSTVLFFYSWNNKVEIFCFINELPRSLPVSEFKSRW